MALNPVGILWYDAQGKPLSTSGTQQAGCQLSFYLTKTLVLTNVYADGLLTTPRPQPIIADASGRFPPIYLDPATIYRYQLLSSTGILLEDIDPYVVGGGSFGPGTANAPSIAFSADTTTGLYNPSPGVLGVAMGGQEVATFTGGLNAGSTETLIAPAGQAASFFVQGNGLSGGDGGLIQYNASNNLRIKNLHSSGVTLLGAQGVDQLQLDGSTIQGLGPVSAAFNDMTPDFGSWTTTLTGGYSSNPTGTLNWKRIGGLAYVYCGASIQGVSSGINNINASLLPAAVTPFSSRTCVCAGIINNSVILWLGVATVNSSGSIDFSLALVSGSNVEYAASNTFTGSNNKGLAAGWMISYPL